MKLKISVTIGDDEVYSMETNSDDEGDVAFHYDEIIGEQLSDLFTDAAHYIQEDMKQIASHYDSKELH